MSTCGGSRYIYVELLLTFSLRDVALWLTVPYWHLINCVNLPSDTKSQFFISSNSITTRSRKKIFLVSFQKRENLAESNEISFSRALAVIESWKHLTNSFECENAIKSVRQCMWHKRIGETMGATDRELFAKSTRKPSSVCNTLSLEPMQKRLSSHENQVRRLDIGFDCQS